MEDCSIKKKGATGLKVLVITFSVLNWLLVTWVHSLYKFMICVSLFIMPQKVSLDLINVLFIWNIYSLCSKNAYLFTTPSYLLIKTERGIALTWNLKAWALETERWRFLLDSVSSLLSDSRQMAWTLVSTSLKRE